LDAKFVDRVSKLYEEWYEPRRFRLNLAAVLALVATAVILVLTGVIFDFYDWLIGWSSNDRPWTSIMQDNPQIYWIAAVVVLIALFKVVPHRASGRLWILTGGFMVGGLGGHVFW
jgi:hypothetical protein